MTIAIWTQAIRPKTFTASISPVAIGSMLALRNGHFDPILFAATLLCALGIQIGTNLANDYFDFVKGADTAARKGPVRVTQACLVSPQAMRVAIFLSLSLTALLSAYLIFCGGLSIAFLSFTAILLALAYTAGPFPLAYLGLGDLFVLFFFGPIATGATYYLQTGALSFEAIFLGFAVGLLSTAILTANNLRDHQEDKRAGKKTLPVRFGIKFGQWEYAVSLILGLLLPTFLGYLFPLLLLPFALLLIRQAFKADFIPLLPKTSLFLLIYTLLILI